MSTSLTIHLKRASKVYHEGDTVAGVVLVESAAGDVRHEGLTLLLEGCVSLQPGARAQGLLDAFAATMRPIPLVSATLELSPAGSLPAGATPIPFELPLRCRAASAAGTPRLLETYHGVFVSVMYALKATLRRPLFSKPLHASCQLFVQYPLQEPAPAKPVRCVITPATVRAGGGAGAGGAPGPRGAGAGQAMPDFQIYAELETTVCALDKPITGKLRVESCSASIKSVELQLVRVETCGAAEAQQRDATEIQNIQVCEGDVARGRDLTLHMVLPRLFTCPTTTTNNFKIEFELNIAVIFEDDYLVTENFPILLLRSR